MKNILNARKIPCRAVKTRYDVYFLVELTEIFVSKKIKKKETVDPEMTAICMNVTNMFSYSLPSIG